MAYQPATSTGLLLAPAQQQDRVHTPMICPLAAMYARRTHQNVPLADRDTKHYSVTYSCKRMHKHKRYTVSMIKMSEDESLEEYRDFSIRHDEETKRNDNRSLVRYTADQKA